jgi:hypothetical protein
LSNKYHQIEFLIVGNLLPSTIVKVRVTENLLLKQAYREGDYSQVGFDTFTLAFVGVPDNSSSNPFLLARDYLEFFLLVYSFVSSQALNYLTGLGTEISTLDDLGIHRVGFSNVKELTALEEDNVPGLSATFHSARKRYLELLEHKKFIMDGYLGIALRYYSYAIQAGARNHPDEVVIDLCIGLEALFSIKPPFKKNLQRRISIFIKENESEQEKIFKDVGEFYRLRGDIVHGMRPNKFKVRSVIVNADYVRRGIDKALSLRLTKEKLIESLDPQSSYLERRSE